MNVCVVYPCCRYIELTESHSSYFKMSYSPLITSEIFRTIQYLESTYSDFTSMAATEK
jgi:hypothetical protein